jgi:hypothetical protein
MPYEVLIGYVYLDSLLRFGDKKTIKSLYNSWTTMNDTLAGALKYLYILNDYNPIIFNQYANEVKFYHKRGERKIKIIGDTSTSSPTSGPYTLYLDRLEWDACQKLLEIYSDFYQRAYYSMLYSDYILRVKIVAIDSMINKNSSFGYYSYNATAMVLDTLKGKVLPESDYSSSEKNNINPNVSSFPATYFNFQYCPFNYGFGVSEPLNVQAYPEYSKPDTAFLDESGDGFKMLVNQEAIVFITFNDQKYDFQYDYYDLELNPRCSLNALRIENGKVLDINNVWSAQTEISYGDWKQIYLNLLGNIMNLSY